MEGRVCEGGGSRGVASRVRRCPICTKLDQITVYDPTTGGGILRLRSMAQVLCDEACLGMLVRQMGICYCLSER